MYATDPDTKQTRDLTPFKGVKVSGIDLDRKFPDEVAVGLNKRNKQLFDQHRITISTAAERLDTENPGNVIGWTSDAEFRVRAATAITPDGGFELKVRDKPGAEWKTVRKWSNEEQGQAVGFGADPNTLYVIASHDANAMRLLKVDLATNKEEVVAEDKEY